MLRPAGINLQLAVVLAGLAACTSADSRGAAGSTRNLAQLDSAVHRLEQNQAHWALWRSPRSTTGIMPYIAWYPEDAFPSKEECHAALKAMIDRMRNGAETDDESYLTSDSRGGTTRHVLRCLPDAIDPRRSQQ
jgi:hypothetical protein